MNYELIVTNAEKKRFKEVLRAKMANRGMRISDLPGMSGYSLQSIYNFMTAGSWNRFLAALLAEKFKISEKEWREKK